MIYLVQCLCPARHCLTAVATDDEPAAAEQDLRRAMQEALVRGVFNPWCSLCGAPARTWRYEAGVTKFRTMDEARPELARLEQENHRTRELLIASGRAYDSQRRSSN